MFEALFRGEGEAEEDSRKINKVAFFLTIILMLILSVSLRFF